MEAQVDLSLDFKMKLEMLSRLKASIVRYLRRLPHSGFPAVTNQEHAFALVWKVHGGMCFISQWVIFQLVERPPAVQRLQSEIFKLRKYFMS